MKDLIVKNESKTLEELTKEVELLKKELRSVNPQTLASGTINALANLLLNPVTPVTLSFSDPSSSAQYPASYKAELVNSAGSLVLVFSAKSQFTTNQDWIPAFGIGVAAQSSFFNTTFFNGNIKMFPSGTGEAEIGTGMNSMDGSYPLQGLGIIGKADSGPGFQTAPVVSIQGALNTYGGWPWFLYGFNRNEYMSFYPPHWLVSQADPQISSTSGWIILPSIKTSGINSSGGITGTTANFSGAVTAGSFNGTINASGVNFTSPITGTNATFSGNITAQSGNIGSLAVNSLFSNGNIAAPSGNISGALTVNELDANYLVKANSINLTDPTQIQFGNNWQNWTPVITAGGSMTASLVLPNYVRYLRIGPFVLMYGLLTVNTSGTASNAVIASYPPGNVCIEATNFIYWGNNIDAAGTKPCVAVAATGGLFFYPGSDTVNWGLGNTKTIAFQVFYRVM